MAQRRGLVDLRDDATDDEDGDDSGASDSEGSLVDFIDKEENDVDVSDAESEGPTTAEEARKRDLEDIDTANIVTGKRTRRATNFYDRAVFASAEYRRMALCDVPKEELHAVVDDDGEEAVDDEDGSYEASSTEEEDEEETCEEEETCAAPVSVKAPAPCRAAAPAAPPAAVGGRGGRLKRGVPPHR